MLPRLSERTTEIRVSGLATEITVTVDGRTMNLPEWIASVENRLTAMGYDLNWLDGITTSHRSEVRR